MSRQFVCRRIMAEAIRPKIYLEIHLDPERDGLWMTSFRLNRFQS